MYLGRNITAAVRVCRNMTIYFAFRIHMIRTSKYHLPTLQSMLFAYPTGKALIAQNKGGGHGELGYHLALKLIEKDISVTLLQDGGGKNKEKQPFARCYVVVYSLPQQYTRIGRLTP